MKTQRFLIATEGTFSGRTISAEEIKAVAANFVSGKKNIPVTYDFYNWSPALSSVAGLAVESDGEKVRLYAEVNVTNELQSMAERKVDYFLVPAIAGGVGNAASTSLVGVGVTKNPLIPGLDKMQFETPNHVDVIFQKQSENINVHLARYYHHGAHAGNVRYEIEAWGMNSPVREAEIKRRLDEFISTLQVGWTES